MICPVVGEDLEAWSELLLRIYYEQGSLLSRFHQLAELEITGDEASASILFRGTSTLTKMLEYYLRVACDDYLMATVGSIVVQLQADNVELEIDPERLKSSHKDGSLATNVSELTRWTGLLWKKIYAERHRCPE